MKDDIQRDADRAFTVQLLKDIPYFHKLYAKYQDRRYLDIAKNLGDVLDSIYKKWEAK